MENKKLPATETRASLEGLDSGNSGRRLVVIPAREQGKRQSKELTNQAARHLLAEFIRELENRKMFAHTATPANLQPFILTNTHLAHASQQSTIDGRGSRGRALRPFWRWWFYGQHPEWSKEIGAFVNLARWHNECAALQGWLEEPVRPFAWLANLHSGNSRPSSGKPLR